MAFIMKGAKVARDKKAKLVKRVQTLKAGGINPTLCIVMVGDRKDADAYAKSASKALTGCGIDCRLTNLPGDIKEERLLHEIKTINEDPEFHGILIMRPLPDSIKWDSIEDAISPEKDVDCITTYNLAKVFKGDDSGFYPCTAQAVMDMLEYYDVELEGKNVAVVGRSLVVGKPVAMLLLKKNATVTLCHSRTRDLNGVTSAADIVVAATGVAHIIGKGSIKRNSIILDVGINVLDGKLVGDVAFDEVEPLVSMISPVPGGIGSVTTAVLMENVVTAAERLTR